MTPNQKKQFWYASVVLGLVGPKEVKDWATKLLDEGQFHEQLMYIADSTNISVAELSGHVRILCEEKSLTWPDPDLAVWWVLTYWFWELEQCNATWPEVRLILDTQLRFCSPVMLHPEKFGRFGLEEVFSLEEKQVPDFVSEWITTHGHLFLE